MGRANLTVVAVLMLAACKAAPNPHSTTPDDELHAKAQALALPHRYDLYVEVWRSQTPRRPVLADDVAALGDPAWTYTIARALDGKAPSCFKRCPYYRRSVELALVSS